MVTKIQVLLLLVLTGVGFARSWTSTQMPSPQEDPSGVCGRGTVKSSICDPDGYISQSDADTIDGLINFVNKGSHGFKKVPCNGGERGAQIAVAVIESMAPASGSKEKRAFQFARDLHDRWGVGDPDCQNGVVLFFAIKDHAMGISTGAGIKPLFKDSMIPNVMAVMRSNLKKGEYGKAIIDGVTVTGTVLSTGKAPDVEDVDDMGSIKGVIGFTAVILGMGGIALASHRKRRRYAQCKKLLERIDKDRVAANNSQYVATSCPICLEDFQQASKSEEQSQSALRMGSVRTVQTGGPMSASSTTTTENVQGTARILSCGHKFHESCILSWISGKGTSNQLCPICRKPVTAEGAEYVEEMTNSGRPGGWDVYDPEYSFRLRRARYLYPDYITWNMITSWEADRYNYSHSIATSSAFVAVDPAVAAAAATAGSTGSSFSFGGGSSAGGGGDGGSW